MSRQFWTDFLELYISFPCLWKRSDDSYKNRNSRYEAMKELLQKLQEVEPLADFKTLTRKINSYRTTFRQVYKKYNMSSKGVDGTDDVEEPTLWYYDILLPTMVSQGSVQHKKNLLDERFFNDRASKVEELESRHSYAMKLQSKDDDTSFFQATDVDVIDGSNTEIVISEPADQHNTDVSTRNTTLTKTNRKRKLQKKMLSKPRQQNPVQDVLDVACDVLARAEQTLFPNRFSAVGSNISAIMEELNNTDPTQCLLAEKLVNDVLFQARLGHLTMDTCIT